MNLVLPVWFGPWGGLVAMEVAVVLVGVGVAAGFVRSASLRRWLWQAGILAVVGIVGFEIAGWRRNSGFAPGLPVRVATVRVGNAEPEPFETGRPAEEQRVGFGMGPVREAQRLSPGGLGQALMLAWVLVAFVLLARLAGGRWALWGRDRAGIAGETTDFDVLVARLGVADVRIRRWAGLPGPVAFGVIRPTIAIPADFEERFSQQEREAMLAHELGHLAGRDPTWFLLMDLLCALGWWHPALWWARRGLRVASEQVADEGSGLIPGGRIALAEALVRLGRTLTVGGGVGVGGSGRRSELARRVEALLKSPEAVRQATPGWRVAVRLAVGVAVLGMALLPVGVLGGEKAQDSRSPSVPSSDASPSAPKPATQATVAIPLGATWTAIAEDGSLISPKLGSVVARSEPEPMIESKLFRSVQQSTWCPAGRVSRSSCRCWRAIPSSSGTMSRRKRRMWAGGRPFRPCPASGSGQRPGRRHSRSDRP